MFILIIYVCFLSAITVDIAQCQSLDTDLTQILNETTATNEIETNEEKELQCSEGYFVDLSTSRCYKLHREMKVWEQAEATCIAEGGHLAVIDDQTESQALSKMNLAKNYPYTHIGLRDITPADEDVEGDWRSVHGTRVEELFNVWDEGSKPTFDFHKCAVVLHTGLLDNYLCDIERDFLCEKDPVYA